MILKTAQQASSMLPSWAPDMFFRPRTKARATRAGQVLAAHYQEQTGLVAANLKQFIDAVYMSTIPCDFLTFFKDDETQFLFFFSDKTALVASAPGKHNLSPPIRTWVDANVLNLVFSPVVLTSPKNNPYYLSYVAPTTRDYRAPLPNLHGPKGVEESELNARLERHVEIAILDGRAIGPLVAPWKATSKDVTAPWILGKSPPSETLSFLERALRAGMQKFMTDSAKRQRYYLQGGCLEENGRISTNGVRVFTRPLYLQEEVNTHHLLTRWMNAVISAGVFPIRPQDLITHDAWSKTPLSSRDITTLLDITIGNPTAHEQLESAALFEQIKATVNL